MAYAHPTPTSRGLTIHGSLVDTAQFANGPSTGPPLGLSISQPDITEVSAPSPTVYQSSPLRARSPASIAGWPLLSPLANTKSASDGGLTRAAEIQPVLELKLAYLSGGRDREGRTIVTIPALQKGAEKPREELANTLYYLVNTVSDEVRENGFCIVVDSRGYSWQTVKQTLRMLQDSLPGQIHVVYIIQQGQFWHRRQSSFSRHSREKARFEFSTITLSSMDKLLRHIEESQLTSDLGGFLPYNHKEWITFRLNLEQFMSEVDALLEKMAILEQHITREAEQVTEDVEGAEKVLQQHCSLEEELKMCPQEVLKMGRDLISSIEQRPDCSGTSSITPDKINASATIRHLLDAIQRRQRQLEEVWRNHKTQLEQSLQLKIFERSVYKVKSWLKGRGMEALSNKQDVGDCLAAAEVLWQQHKNLEAKAQNIYDNLTQLRLMVDKLCGNKHYASADMRQCIAKLSNRYTFFDARLQERSDILRLSMTFYKHLEQWRQKCGGCREEVMKEGLSLDDSTEAQDRQMDELRQSGEQLVQEGRGLLEMMQQQAELQMPHPPDYKKAAHYVRHCLDEVEDKQKHTEQLAEARKVRLDQFKQVYTCERDAKQALRDLEHLLKQLSSCLGDLGSNLAATTKLRDEHTKITRAAKKTHEYGKDLLSAACKGRQACSMPQKPNQALLEQLSTSWESIVSRSNQHTNWMDMLMTFFTGQREVQQQLLWLQQQSSGKLQELDQAESSLTKINEMGPSVKQTAADTLDLGSDLLDELEQAKHFPTRDAACQSVRQQLEKLSVLTKQHTALLEECEKKLSDCIELRQLEQQANQVMQWIKQSGHPHLSPSLGKDLRTCEEQQSKLESHNETVEEYSKKTDELLKSVTAMKHNQFSDRLQQVSQEMEQQWRTFSKRWRHREQRLSAAVHYHTTINHLQQQFELFEGHMRLVDLPEEADEIELHLEKTQADRKDLLKTFRQALEDGRTFTEQLIHGDQGDIDLLAAQSINEELDQLDKQRTKLDELWIKTQKYLNQSLELQQKQQVNVSSLSPSEWLGSVAEPFISSMPIGTSSSETDEVIAKLDVCVKQAEDYQKRLGQNRDHVKDALRRAREELRGRRSLLLQLRLLYSNIERCSRKLDALKDKQDPMLKEKVMNSVSEILKEGNLLISQLEQFPLSSVRQVEMVCDRLKEKAGLSKRGSFSTESSPYPSSNKPISKSDITKQLEAFESASETFLLTHIDLGDSAASAKALLKQYQQFQDATEPMIKDLERAWQQRSKGEADLSDIYERFTRATLSCRQVVTKRLTIITSLVDYHEQWKLLQDSLRELDELLEESFQHSCTQLDARNQLEHGRPMLQELHGSHEQCKSHGKQFIEMASSEVEHSGESHDHVSSLKVAAAAAKIKQQLDDAGQRVHRVHQEWEEREHLLSHCIQGHALQIDCKKVTGELQRMLDSLEKVDLGTSLEASEQLLQEHNQALQRLKELEQEVEELQEDANDMTEDNHYNASSLAEATLSLRSLYKQTQTKMNERQQLLESSGNFFARSMELLQDFNSAMREKVCRPAKLEGFSSRLSALCSEGTSLVAMARGSVGRGPRSERVSSQGIDDTITSLQHKMECYRKLERRGSVNLSSSSTSSALKNTKRFSMGNFDDFSIVPKLELTAHPLPAASRLFPEKKKQEGLRRAGSMRVERSVPVQKLSSKFERSALDDSYKPTPPERVDSFNYLKSKRKTSVNTLRQRFEQLSVDQTTPTSSMEDLSASMPAGGATTTKTAEPPGKDSPEKMKQNVPPIERGRANTMPSPAKSSPPTKRLDSLKQSSFEERAESPKVSPQAIEAILESLSTSDNGDKKVAGDVAAGNRLSQQLHSQLPQLEESSDEEEELNKEMESFSANTGVDEPDFGKEKLKSLGAVTRELITGEALYLQSLQCIVEGYIPAWDQPYLAAFLVGKKEIIFSNLADIYHFQKRFYEKLLTCTGVQEICQCFKAHEEGFSLYLVYLKSLPQGKKVLSEFGGDFFEMVRKDKRYSRSFSSNYLHASERLDQYMANFKEMMNAAQKEELHSVDIIRDTLKIFQRIDRILTFTCIINNPETLDENQCLLMDDFMVYTVKKKKKRADEMRVFLHEKCVIFTKVITSAEESSLSNRRAFEHHYSIEVNHLKLSETVEKGKHPEKFGLAENKAGPEREYILQPIGKSVEVKQEWCAEVNKLLSQQLEKLKQAKAHDSGSKSTEALPPPMMHVVKLPPRYHKFKKSTKRDSEGGRGSVFSRSSKHDSIRDSTLSGTLRSSEHDIRHISIELPQPLPSASSSSDLTIFYEVTEPYDSLGKDGYLTLDKGCHVEVLDNSSSDWLVCTVPETCNGVEKEGIVPMHILTPVTRHASRAISKQVSTTSSAVSKRYSLISVRSNRSDHSSNMSTVPIPLYDEDHYVIVQPSKASTASKVSQPIVPSAMSPPSNEQYVYYAVEDYCPNKEGYVRLIAGEAVEVLDKSNPKEWVIATVGNEARPSEEGLVPAKVLSAEYIPVRYDSIQGGYSGSDSGSDDEQVVKKRRSSKQQDKPPPVPPNHPSHDNDAINSASEEEAGTNDLPLQTKDSLQTENISESLSDNKQEVTENSPKLDTGPAITILEGQNEDEVKVEEEYEDENEDASSEHSDTTPIVSPRGSLYSGSNKSSPMFKKRDPLPSDHGKNPHLLTKSLTAVELVVPSKRKGVMGGLHRFGSDPSLQDAVPLSDSSPAFSIPNLAAAEGGNSPMHERVSSILRESLMSTARNRHHHSLGRSSPPERRRISVTSPIGTVTSPKSTTVMSPIVAELKDILNRSQVLKSDGSGGVGNKTASHHNNRSSSISPEDALLSEMKKLQLESVEQSSGSNKMEEMDEIEIYVSIADYMPEEESNIPLYCGQHVQVLDSSREDWWLVLPMAMTEEESSGDPPKEGWVPANHLEKLISEGSHDPSDDTSSHDTTAEEKLRELYNCSFLVDDPSPAQLEGMFSIAHPYMAKEAIQGKMPGQLSLHSNQVVQVLDSKPDDWWLVVTIATDKVPAIKGWAPAASLVATSNNEAVSQDLEQPPVWYVRATFQSKEEGMLSIQEGELVIVLDSSNDQWYLARTVQRDPPCEGWVPASYVYQLESTDEFDIPTHYEEALHSPWQRSAHQNSQSESSSDECDGDVTQLLHEQLTSPDFTEDGDGEDHREVAREKRAYVISELIESEKDYVERLRYCIENYVTAVISSVAPKMLNSMKDVLFCNMEAIHDFHRSVFLPQLEQCNDDHIAVASCFVNHASQLEMYVNYCTYQAKSDSVFKEYCNFFADLNTQLKDRWQLADYLILPVQRITKYSLLLEHVLKYSIRAGEDCDEIDAALDITRGVSLHANNAIHLSMLDIDERKQKNYGSMIMQEKFELVERVEGGRTRLKDRRLFLFEHVLVLSKKKRDDVDQESYFIKEALKLNELSASQDSDNAGLCLILYEMHSGSKYTLRAPSLAIRDAWLGRLQELISVNKSKNDSRKRSASEAAEFNRSPAIARKLPFRQTNKKKIEHSMSYPGSITTSDDTEAQPGTQFLVLERIVMEGGDDLQLEPGEVVELVRKENNSTLYVRTLETADAPPMEGNVPASFLRRKCVHKQSGQSEAMPKITKRPSNQTVSLGHSVTFSSIFNGFPTPSVTWRKGSVTLTPSERCKITVLSNSTLFELPNVKFSDAGEYSCAVSNSAGTDTATVELCVVGPPDFPTRPTVSKVATTSLRLKWLPPEFDGNSEITTYQVEQLQEGLIEWLPIVQQPKTVFVVKTLEPNTSYQFRIIAYNEFGPSQPSEPSQTVFTKSTNKGFLTSASPSFRKKIVPTNSNNHDSKSTDMTDYDFLSQQPPTMGSNLGLPSSVQSLSQPPMDDAVFTTTINSPPPSYIRTTPITASYDLTLEELGRGRYGIVQRCISKKTQEAVATKYLRLRTKRRVEIRREADLHQRLLHPHIITFFDAYEAGRNLIIVMEIATGGELLDYIVQTKTLTEAIAVKYISQVISALQYMHSLGVAHMDIRPENILLSSQTEPIVKLIDLGSARDLSLRVTPASYGSPEFCAPEILNKESVNEAADMWGLGALTYVILSGVSPFFGENPQITRFHIKEVRYDFNASAFEQVSQDAKDFIRSLLQLNPLDRLSAVACQDHPWIKTLNPKGTGIPSWPMAKLDLSRLKTFIARRKWHSSNIAVETNHVFGGRMPSVISRNSTEPSDLQDGVPPSLSGGPDNLVVKATETVSFCHQVQGTPAPSIQWEHNNKQLLHSARVKFINDGTNVSLTMADVGRLDEGVYTCTALNSLGSMSAQTKLVVLDKPLSPSDLNSVSLGNNSALVSWSRPTHDGSSAITGYRLEHKRVDQDTWVLSAEEIHSTAHVVDDLLPGNSYQFRVAAVNASGCSQFSKPSGTVSVDSPEEEEWDPMEAVKIKHTPFEQEYTFKEVIAKGSFSLVKVCVENSTDRLYAAKVVNLDSKQRSTQALHEFDMLANLSHPRIVTIETAFQSPTNFILVMEYLSGGELLAHLAEKESLTEEECSHYMRQVLEGLHYIHTNNIIHMAVKPENIVLTSNHRDIKLVDFRLARYIQAGNQLEAIEGNPEYMAPETVSLKPVTIAADIWSVGIITCIMLTGVSPFLGKDTISTIANIQAAKLDNVLAALNEVSHDAKDFIINNVLKTNPRRRLTAAQLLRHRWLQASSRLTVSRSNSIQETGRLKQFIQHRKVPVSQE